MTYVSHTTVNSPVGPLTLVACDGILTGLYMQDQRSRPTTETFGVHDSASFAETARQLEAYFCGELTQFDIPFSPQGTSFQRAVWDALRTIPYGETISYGELARWIGRPTAARAVGLANGRNPIGIIIPCHRVVGSTGNLTGYGGGLERKQLLLALEQRNNMLFG